MTTTEAPSQTFDSLNPATGEVVETFPVHGQADVDAAVERARAAARWWGGLGFDGRAKRLKAWARELSRGLEELAEVMHREGGKPVDDALLEASLAIEHVHWAATHAGKVLGRRKVAPGLLLANHVASVAYEPYGVVGVIGPWNYPVFTPMGSIAYALAAGNAVAFKPSEYTPAVGAWLVRSFARIAPEAPVFQLVTGLGPTGAALTRAGVDKVAFTGSAATGKRVMAACAETLTPVVIEAGGKDVLIVDRDADLDAAADAALWGGMSNAGQTCVGVERVYVHTDVYDEFMPKLTAAAERLRPGDGADASYGPMTMPSQIEVVRRHIDDAIARGGRAVVGGPESVRPPYVDPVVLVDVPEDSLAVTEETFGPTLVVNRVDGIEDAITRANATSYGLGGTVFSKARGERIARRLRSGMVSVNSVISFAGIPSLPFGGVGQSGFGRIHGADGLREFARPQAVARLLVPVPMVLTTFRRKGYAIRTLVKAIKTRYGR